MAKPSSPERRFHTWGLPRHLLLAFPVFIGATPFFERGKRRFMLAAVFLPAMLFVVMMYVLRRGYLSVYGSAGVSRRRNRGRSPVSPLRRNVGAVAA